MSRTPIHISFWPSGAFPLMSERVTPLDIVEAGCGGDFGLASPASCIYDCSIGKGYLPVPVNAWPRSSVT